ncbi:MAG: MFS transporter [Gemmatimonadaceae bacterium]|nr:MFS transporter [Gemmatimonadaceae bacterium]
MTDRRGLLDHLGLHRPELRAWAMYDWGISAYQTVIMAAVFPIFFNQYAARGMGDAEKLQWFSYAQTVGAVVIAVLAPILGAVADYKAAKKRFLGWFMILGVGSTSAMFLIGQGDVLLACVLLILSLAGATGSTTFYEALLPHIASEEEMDRVSTAGYALGYVGGGLLLFLNLAVIQDPGLIGLPSGEGLTPEQASLPTRLGFLSTGLWWLLFSIPVLRRVPEPARAIETDEAVGANPFGIAFSRLGETLRELRGYKQAFLMMVAFTIYNDGIQTIIKMAASYGDVMGIERKHLITAILIVQFVGIPCAFAFGYVARWLGAKRSVLLGIAAYAGICIFAYWMDTTREFYILAILLGLVQGGTQALSRSMFANMIPRHKSGEFFGFFSVFEKFGGILGPLVFGLAVGAGRSPSSAILSVIAFFVVGGAILLFVDPKEGERAAREADAAVRRVPG